MTERTALRGLTRRGATKLIGAAALAGGFASHLTRPARAAGERHGMSVFGDLKYGPGFAHFDYVQPSAPKGGTLSHIGPTTAYNQNFLTFNTLNSFILKGDAAQGLEFVFDGLMDRAFDEPDAIYGLIARTVEIADDGNAVRFRIDERARFHDGTPIRPEDAVFSLQILKDKGHPFISQSMREVAAVAVAGDGRVEVRFTGSQSRDLPLVVAQLPIFSQAYYATHAFDETTLEPPLGSGPYKIGRFEQGRFIEYDRVEDYWAADLPVRRGQFNFATMRYEFYRDRTAQVEAFKSGDYLLREEFTSKTWATGYDFPAVNDGRVKLDTLPDETPSGAQGWFINLRRERFADPKVREALILTFDFEWTNKTLFYGLYDRTQSFFENSEMKAEGPPSSAELVLLDPYREELPEEVFAEPFAPPVSDGSGQDRRLLRRAAGLLADAGWNIEGGSLRNAAGEVFAIEFLEDSPSFERITQPYVKVLRDILGIDARFRLVDPAQYQQRLNEFDFDLTTRRYSMSQTPGEGIRRYWSSADADTPGSRNLSGIKSPVIDALTDKVVGAASREEMTVAARALDRVLRAGRYWVPQWYKAVHTIAYWDTYSRPAIKPRYDRGIIHTWWHDTEKAARIGL